MTAHAEFLRSASKDSTLAAQVKEDFHKAKLPLKDLRMLDFVKLLTTHPWLLGQNDVEELRRVGFKDIEILHVVLGCAHFNYYNRMADGIGIRLEYRSDLPSLVPPSDSRSDSQQELAEPISPTSSSSYAWIRAVRDNSFKPRVDEPRNLFALMSANVPARDLGREWRDYQLKPTAELDAVRRARLALYISALNRCEYDILWLRRQLKMLGSDESVTEWLARGRLPENFSRTDQILFEHASHLTRIPWTVREEDIQHLRKAGLDDHGILQLTMLSAYWNYENRVVLGLGVPLEEKEDLSKPQ